jgi:hypothetical protein
MEQAGIGNKLARVARLDAALKDSRTQRGPANPVK